LAAALLLLLLELLLRLLTLAELEAAMYSD
jgi:hypothetical protein